MRKDLTTLAIELERRALTDDDIRALRSHAQRRAAVTALAGELKAHEHRIVSGAVRDLYAKYPEKLTAYVGCDEKTRRDMKLVLRYCLYSIVLDDPDYAKDKMFYWFRTILNAFSFGKEFIEDAYRFAQKHAKERLSPEAAQRLNAEIDEAIAVFNS